MNFTPQQKDAIAARGNVLVMAGAGTGKTRTLVERCLSLLTSETPPVSLDQILLVTFTEAAAAEMRQRIRQRLEAELARDPKSNRWQEQLALFDTAHIGTLHGFCLKIVREHFYELGLDPQLAVLPEEEARLLADETLDAILQSHYAGMDGVAEAVQGLVQTQGRGWDKPVRALVLKLHHYTQTRPDADGWFDEQIKMFESPTPTVWREWLLEGAAEWCAGERDFLAGRADQNEIATKTLAALEKLPTKFSRAELAATLQRLLEIPGECPRGKKGKWVDPIGHVFSAAEFLLPLAREQSEADALKEDWSWSRTHMTALLRLAQEFSRQFAAAKRELGALDFHDLEQHALRLLWDSEKKSPTSIAQEWREKLRFVFVDEYQDINAAQDGIIAGLCRDGRDANRFLVGDIKQSIYRFRLANPKIFQHYAETWRGDAGKTIPLTENFRSREGIIEFVNSLFTQVMRRDVGGLVYDEQARLRFGAAEERSEFSMAKDQSPRVELHLRLTDGETAVEEGEESDAAEIRDANLEARLVARRLRELKQAAHPVWDEKIGGLRPVEWSDMAVLLRSPGTKAEIFAKEFSQLGVPLVVARGGFFASLEISDLLNLLRLLDNPLQDVPALAVLHSPLVGLSLNELAEVRLAATKVPIWTALVRSQQGGTANPKVAEFLRRFVKWRRLARQVSLSRCLEKVLAETHYAEGLLTLTRGEQRRANVRRLLGLTQQFDQFQRQGLFRFLRFVEAQQAVELEPELAAAAPQNAVRLMSIHQSKGLEFPVVALANLAKRFNFSDTKAEVILDEEFGLCPQIKPPQTGRCYPSLPYWLARRRQEIETLGEELRLLYVATTRARDTLILTATLSEKKFNSDWLAAEESPASPTQPLSARSYANWLGMWFAKNCPAGKSPLLHWEICGDAGLSAEDSTALQIAADAGEFSVGPEVWENIFARLNWRYPHTAATNKAAKVSVSTLRREAADEESEELFASAGTRPKSSGRIRPRKADGKSAADLGTVHHRFLQCVELDRTGSVKELQQEAERLTAAGILSAEEAGVLDFAALAGFWQSELGLKIRAQAGNVQRELAFTAKFSLAALVELTGKTLADGLAEEFVVVQGVADLAVILEKEIWLVDFKTDDLGSDEVAARTKTYAPQLRLYAAALSRIHGRQNVQSWLYFLSVGRAVSVA